MAFACGKVLFVRHFKRTTKQLQKSQRDIGCFVLVLSYGEIVSFLTYLLIIIREFFFFFKFLLLMFIFILHLVFIVYFCLLDGFLPCPAFFLVSLPFFSLVFLHSLSFFNKLFSIFS